MSLHLDTIFSGSVDAPHLAFRAYNKGATSLEPGYVVTFYPETTTTDRIWVRGYTAGDDQPGDNTTENTDPKYKVAGCVYSGTVLTDASGIIVYSGAVTNLRATGSINANDILVLSGSTYVAQSGVTAGERGNGWGFAVAMETSAGGARGISAMMIPWRI